MKKLGLPDSADVNLCPPSPIYSGSEHNCLIFRKKERKKTENACQALLSPALLSCKALALFWRTALTPWALARGTRWSATWACSRVSRAVVNKECDSGYIRACMAPIWEICAGFFSVVSCHSRGLDTVWDGPQAPCLTGFRAAFLGSAPQWPPL